MTPLQLEIERRGGLMAAHEIRSALRIGPLLISAAVAGGEIVRVRQGWYACPWLPIADQHAARVGGQLACSSAAAALGLWSPRVAELHVCVPPNAARLRRATAYRSRLRPEDAVEVHWTGLDPLGSRTRVSVTGCIGQVARCAAPEVALAVAESALHRRLLLPEAWERFLDEQPPALLELLERAGTGSETGSESVFRYRMAQAGVLVRQQVVVPGVGRVDGLIGDRLVVEIDSVEFHSDPAADRLRDARLSALGYRVLRFMYSQVMDEWPLVEAAVLAAIARGDHLAPSSARMKEACGRRRRVAADTPVDPPRVLHPCRAVRGRCGRSP